jgi:hypothetical protein
MSTVSRCAYSVTIFYRFHVVPGRYSSKVPVNLYIYIYMNVRILFPDVSRQLRLLRSNSRACYVRGVMFCLTDFSTNVLTFLKAILHDTKQHLM